MKQKIKIILMSLICVLVFAAVGAYTLITMTEKYVYRGRNAVITSCFKGEEFISYKVEADINCTGSANVETTYKLYSPALWINDYKGISVNLEKGENCIKYREQITFSQLTAEGYEVLGDGFASKSNFLSNIDLEKGILSKYLIVLGVPICIEQKGTIPKSDAIPENDIYRRVDDTQFDYKDYDIYTSEKLSFSYPRGWKVDKKGEFFGSWIIQLYFGENASGFVNISVSQDEYINIEQAYYNMQDIIGEEKKEIESRSVTYSKNNIKCKQFIYVLEENTTKTLSAVAVVNDKFIYITYQCRDDEMFDGNMEKVERIIASMKIKE